MKKNTTGIIRNAQTIINAVIYDISLSCHMA